MTSSSEIPTTSFPATTPSLLVFGAGYVGGEVVRQAVARGWRVAALTRNAEKAQQLRAVGCVAVIEADLASDSWHSAATAAGPFQFVLNAVSSSGGGLDGYRRSYLDGTRSIMTWLGGQPRGGTIVYTSSTGVYPQGGGVRVTEESSTQETAGSGRILLDAEQLLREGAATARWRAFVLRLAGIYGPGRHGVLDQLRGGATTLGGDPNHRMNLIHRDDAAVAIAACFAAAPSVGTETFNLCDGEPASRREFANWIARAIDVVEPVIDAASPVRTGATAGGSGRGPAPDRVIVAERIRRVLGWSPKYADFRAGYAALLDLPG